MILSDEQKTKLMIVADALLRMRSGTEHGHILFAKWDESWNDYRPFLITWPEFDADDSYLLVDKDYEPVTYQPDTEPERKIKTGSIDPKSGRRRKVIDVEALWYPPKAASIPDQVDWKKVPKYKLPDLDTVHGWSAATDKEVTKMLIQEKLYKPETSPIIPRMDFNKILFHHNESVIPLAHTEAVAKRLHEKYPESDFDRYFQNKIAWDQVFSRLTPEPALYEAMRVPPESLKISMLRNLVDSGHFDSMPFKMRMTAMLLSRGYTNAEEAAEAFITHAVGLRGLDEEDFKRFLWIYTEKDFYTFQSVISILLEGLDEGKFKEISPDVSFASFGGRLHVKSLWARFEEAWDELTLKQKKAVSAIYMGDERRKLEAVASKLKISVPSLRDRLSGAAKKLRDAFPEFAKLRPTRTHTATSKRPLIFDGLYRRASADKIWPLVRIKKAGEFERRTVLPLPDEVDKPKPRPMDPIIASWLHQYRIKADLVAKLDEPLEMRPMAAGSDLKEGGEDIDRQEQMDDVFQAHPWNKFIFSDRIIEENKDIEDV